MAASFVLAYMRKTYVPHRAYIIYLLQQFNAFVIIIEFFLPFMCGMKGLYWSTLLKPRRQHLQVLVPL